MSIHFNTWNDLMEFLERAGYKVIPPETTYHYLIVGKYTKAPIGCTWDREDVLMEEQGVTFEVIPVEKCPMCNQRD